MPETPTPGQVAYMAFARARQLEHELSLWGLLPPYMQEAWEAAAQAVLTQAGLLVLDLDPDVNAPDTDQQGSAQSPPRPSP